MAGSSSQGPNGRMQLTLDSDLNFSPVISVKKMARYMCQMWELAPIATHLCPSSCLLHDSLLVFALYVFNKCLALSAFILLIVNFGLGPARKLGAGVPDTWLAARKEIGIFSFMLVLSHMLSAMLLFGVDGYYGKFFSPEGGLSAVGSWSMLFGVLAFTWLWLYNISFKSRQEGDEEFIRLITSRGSLLFAGFLAAGHVVVMGFKGWLQPDTWPGMMPPITMVAMAVYLVGLVIFLAGRR